MGSIFESFAEGLGKAIGSIFHAPVDFLTGKSCSSVCAPTWDVTCYIENFCIANLLKLALVLVVFYIVFLFIYLTYKLKVFHCIICCIFKTAWGCCSTCFCACSRCCDCLYHELSNTKRRPRRTRMSHVENISPNHEHNVGESFTFQGRSQTRRHHRRHHLIRNSLRARSHRTQVGIGKEHEHGGRGHDHSMKGYVKNRHGAIDDDARHGVRVRRTTKFAHKGFGSSSSLRLKPKVVDLYLSSD